VEQLMAADSSSQITPTVTRLASTLQEHAQKMEQALRNTGHSTWFDPSTDDDKVDLTDPASISPLFKRSDLSEQFGKATQGSGSGGDVSLVGLQGSFLQSLEMAYRSRHLTFNRAMAHAAARCHGHAQPQGPIHRALIGYFQFIAAKAKVGGGGASDGATGE
jgi:hypothetical protein